MPNQMAAVNDVKEFTPSRSNGTIAVQLDLNGAAGVQVVVEGKVSDARGWKQLKLTDPTTKTDVDFLSTDEQIGWVENIGYSRCRTRLAAISSGGPVEVAISTPEN